MASSCRSKFLKALSLSLSLSVMFVCSLVWGGVRSAAGPILFPSYTFCLYLSCAMYTRGTTVRHLFHSQCQPLLPTPGHILRPPALWNLSLFRNPLKIKQKFANVWKTTIFSSPASSSFLVANFYNQFSCKFQKTPFYSNSIDFFFATMCSIPFAGSYCRQRNKKLLKLSSNEIIRAITFADRLKIQLEIKTNEFPKTQSRDSSEGHNWWTGHWVTLRLFKCSTESGYCNSLNVCIDFIFFFILKLYVRNNWKRSDSKKKKIPHSDCTKRIEKLF